MRRMKTVIHGTRVVAALNLVDTSCGAEILSVEQSCVRCGANGFWVNQRNIGGHRGNVMLT